MSKRTTTGLPDKDKSNASKPVVEKTSLQKFWDNLLGNPKNRKEREDAFNRLIVRTIVGVGVVVGVLLAIAVVNEQIIVPGQTVATVNGEAITVRQFRDQVRFEQVRLTNQLNATVSQLQQFGIDPNQYLREQEPYKTWINELNFPDQLGRRVLNAIIDDTLARQQAETLNIVVSEELIQEKVNNFFQYDPTQVSLTGAEPTATLTPTITPTPYVSPTPTPLPTATPQPSATPTPDAEATAELTPEASPTLELPTFTPEPTLSIEQQQQDFAQRVDEYNRAIRDVAGVGQDVIDESFEREALQDAIGEYLLGEDRRVMYVNLRHILVATREEALDVIAALQAGESFAALAAAVSTDTGSAQNGGLYDWAPALNYVEAFKEAALTLELGVISEPVETEFGFHVMQVIGREERVVEEEDEDRIKQALYSEWIKKVRAENEANIIINDNWVDFVPAVG
jgi:parvulin-like peptidyl-prolyl isomerase